MKRLSLLVALGVILTVGFLYSNKEKYLGPKHSLKAIHRALDARDAAAFQRYVDLNSLTLDAADYVLSTLEPQSQFGDFMKSVVDVVIGIGEDRIAEIIERRVLQRVERGSFLQDSSEALGESAGLTQVLNMRLWMPLNQCVFNGLGASRSEGVLRILELKLDLPRYNEEVSAAELVFRYNGDVWQLTSLEDLSGFFQRIDQLETERTAQANSHVQEVMDGHVSYDSRWQTGGLINRKLWLHLNVSNIGDETLQNGKFTFTFLDRSGELVDEIDFQRRLQLSPGQIKVLEKTVDLDTIRIPRHLRLWRLARSNDLHLEVVLTKLLLGNEESLSLVQQWGDIPEIIGDVSIARPNQ